MARKAEGPKLVLFGPDKKHGAKIKPGQVKYIWHAKWYEDGIARLRSLGVEFPKTAQKEFAEFLVDWHAKAELGQKTRGEQDAPVSKLIYWYQQARVKAAINGAGLDHRCKNLAAFFKNAMMSDIDEDLCRRYAMTRPSPGTARLELGALSTILKYAVDNRYVTWRPKVWRPEAPDSNGVVLSRKDIARIIRWMRARQYRGKRGCKHHAVTIAVCYRTAARLDSVMQLRPYKSALGGFVDADKGLIHLNPEGRPKTKKVKPTIPIPRAVRSVVVCRTRRGLPVCADDKGRIPTKFQHERIWRTALMQLKIKRCTPHSLRHSRITHLLAGRVPIALVSEYVGLSVKNIQKTYSHLLANDVREVADA